MSHFSFSGDPLTLSAYNFPPLYHLHIIGKSCKLHLQNYLISYIFFFFHFCYNHPTSNGLQFTIPTSERLNTHVQALTHGICLPITLQCLQNIIRRHCVLYLACDSPSCLRWAPHLMYSWFPSHNGLLFFTWRPLAPVSLPGIQLPILLLQFLAGLALSLSLSLSS